MFKLYNCNDFVCIKSQKLIHILLLSIPYNNIILCIYRRYGIYYQVSVLFNNLKTIYFYNVIISSVILKKHNIFNYKHKLHAGLTTK